MKQRTLAENLDALFAGTDSDSGIRDPELLDSCIAELNRQAEELSRTHPSALTFLDVAWGIAMELYGQEPYGAEDRLHFIQWLRDEAGW